MHAATDTSASQPVVMRFLVRSWEYRHPRLWVGLRVACGIFNVCPRGSAARFRPLAGAADLAGSAAAAGAALIFWTVYRLQQDSISRVRELEQSRAHVVDDSAARLRRIERDLHDGAQAQMVAVAMKLGLAREKLGGTIAGTAFAGTAQADLERVLELVDAAHRSAKDAITELRDLARGIHPPALDHGLGAALATLAARSDVPVELVVDLPERPSAAIETIAYFCAAELLTNVAKHSGARHATLEAVARARAAAGAGQRRRHAAAPASRRRRPGRTRRPGQDRRRQARDQQPARRPHGGRRRAAVPRLTETGDPMRIVIAEDSAIVRAGLVEILADRGHEVVAAVGDAEALRAAVDVHQPDVAVVDVRMPPGYTDEGLRAAIAIRRDHPKTGVLVFSQYIETRYAAELLGAASGGGAAGVGYLLKTGSPTSASSSRR